MRKSHRCFAGVLLAGIATSLLATPGLASGFTVLHAFSGPDGYSPHANLSVDRSGNITGTTEFGGTDDNGTIFRIAPDGSETVLHEFTGTDGRLPLARLRHDSAGNYFGTTQEAGQGGGQGTVFKLAPDGMLTTLYSFSGGADGSYAEGSLLGLTGTTAFGGANQLGVIFKLDRNGQETVLHSFGAGSDGANPVSDLVKDAQGNIYGVTEQGGIPGCGNGQGCGTVFKLAPDGTETVLHAFAFGEDGIGPAGGLAIDRQGNLYGTTTLGGGNGCAFEVGCGLVFKITPDGTESIVYNFKGGDDGFEPFATLKLDGKGNLYGTTIYGGGDGCNGYGCGTVFRIAPDGTETVLHAFDGPTEGGYPEAGLSADGPGMLVGTTTQFGPGGGGTVFRISKH